MPDINLAENTNRPELGVKAPRPIGEPVLTEPAAGKSGIGGLFRSMFRGKQAPLDPVPGTPVRKAARSNERILSEKRSDSGPSLIPLPEVGDLEVNLISEEMSHQFMPRQRVMQLGLFMLGAAALVAAAYFGLQVYEKSLDQKVAQTKQEASVVRTEVTKLQTDAVEVQVTTDKVKAIRTLLGNHIHWTQFFYQLERYTLPSVTYGSSFTANIQGTITLSAKTDTYEHAAQQYLLLKQAVEQKDFIKSFSITAATKQKEKDTSVVTFSVTLDLLSSLFTERVTPITTSHSDLLVTACYILGHQEIVASFPVAIRADFTLAKLPVKAADCTPISATELDRAKNLLTSDDDSDGLVNYLEILAGTPLDKADTDTDLQNDLVEVLACTNPLGVGVTASCDVQHPLIPKL